MEKLILLEQNNERLHSLLIQHFSQLEELYEGISDKYHQFHQSISHISIEERAMLLLEVSRQTIQLYDQNEEQVQSLIQQLKTVPTSSFASILLNTVEHDPLKIFSQLDIS